MSGGWWRESASEGTQHGMPSSMVSVGEFTTRKGLSPLAEPRLSVGIPVIGCPDYLALMRDRANASGLQFGPPILPDSLLEVIERESPVGSLGTGKSPYLGKKILVLVGGEDELVPWVFSKPFVERVEVGEGVKKVVVYPDVGHEFTASMVEDITNFVWEEGCRVDA